MQHSGPFSSDYWPFILACVAIVSGAAFLRFFHLGTEELWLDEAISAYLIDKSGWTVLENNTPPLYYTLLKLWSFLVGTSEFALRSLSALAGSLFVLATIWLGKEIFNRSVGLWSGLFVAVNPMAIYYSQEARAYALLLLLLALAYATLWIALAKGSGKHWLLFALVALLALYSHYLSLLALVPTAVLVLLWPEQEQKGRPWLYYGCAIILCAVLFLPMVAFKFVGAGQVVGVSWLDAIWWVSSPWLLIPQSLEVFGLGGERELTLVRLKQLTDMEFPLWFRISGVSILGLLLVAALIPQGDRSLGVPWIGRRKIWLVTLVCVPLLLLLGISFVRPLYVVGRYDMIGFPGYALLLGLGAAKIQRMGRFGSLLMLSIAVCLLGVFGTKLFYYYRVGTPARFANSRATAAFLAANTNNGDVAVFTGLRSAPVIYYLHRLGYDWSAGRCLDESNGRYFGCRTFPRETESHLGAYESERVWNSRDEVRADLDGIVRGLGNRNSSLWIVVEPQRVESRRIMLQPVDNSLITELKGLGYTLRHLRGELRIFQFGKTSAPN